MCCHDDFLSYPMNIPVFIRGCSRLTAPVLLQSHQSVYVHSRTSITPLPSHGNSGEHVASQAKGMLRGQISSVGQHTSVTNVVSIENDNQSASMTGTTMSNIDSIEKFIELFDI
jgi:hypothetical protein